MTRKHSTMRGSASLYSVTILIMFVSVVVVGFVTLMIPVIRRANRFSQSESAYEAAMAGVENAKIAIKYYESCIADGSTYSDCQKIKNAFANSSSNCTFLNDTELFGSSGSDETKIGEVSTDSRAFDQAYTCVRVNLRPGDYLGTLREKAPSQTIPLRTLDNNQAKYVQISWFTNENKNLSTSLALANDSGSQLIALNKPSSLRVELIYRTGIKELVLAPSSNANAANVPGNTITSSTWQKQPYSIMCDDALAYKCTAKIFIGDIMSDPNSATFAPLLRVVLMDGKTESDYQVSILQGDVSTSQPLDGAQITIDSTGRSGTAFRRVETRLEYGGSDSMFFNYSLSILGGDLDKSHYVTSNCKKLNNSLKTTSINGYNDIELAKLNISEVNCSNYE